MILMPFVFGLLKLKLGTFGSFGLNASRGETLVLVVSLFGTFLLLIHHSGGKFPILDIVPLLMVMAV